MQLGDLGSILASKYAICMAEGYAVGLLYAVKKYIGRAKCIVCPTNPTVTRPLSSRAPNVAALISSSVGFSFCVKATSV